MKGVPGGAQNFLEWLVVVVVMRKLSVPADSIPGRLPGSQHFVDVYRNREAEQIPGLLIFRPNGILFFANASRVHKHLRELMKRTNPRLRAVVLDLESCPETDVTSLEMLGQLKNELHDAGVDLYLARVADPVLDLFDRGGFLERLGPGRVFPE
jgi:sulfate permease, SulP family